MITMLSDADSVLQVARAALSASDPPDVWIQMSTIGVQGAERCAELADDRDVTYVDAPVLGTRAPAEQGKLVILASGPEAAHPAADPVFEAVGARTQWLGEAGAATAAKVAINSWVVGVVGVLAETITLSEALGVDPQIFFDAVEGGPLDLGYARVKGPAMMKRAFDDVSFRLALARKDGDLVLAAAAEVGLRLPVMEGVVTRLRAAEADGHGDEDMAATYWASAPSDANQAR
jgi:3-hydroxyisobutyrate dehydrogenase